MLVDVSQDKKHANQQQISSFIDNLKERTVELDRWTKIAEQSLEKDGDGFRTYLEFRDLVIECESFNEVIQRRLRNLKESGVADQKSLQAQLDDLSARQLTLAIHASLKFLRYIANKNLPIGSRDVFIRELRDLHRMKQALDSKRLKGKIDEKALADQRKVEEILNTVISKAPELFSFDDAEPDDQDVIREY